MPGPHEKIIAVAAKAALSPHGFRRKGQSRTWLADHGWWLTVVEFQPSSWSKGSYLNVAAHWLWSELGCLSFDSGGRVAEFEEYLSNEQFEPAAARLADCAARIAQRLAETFTSVELTANRLLNRERTRPHREQGLWSAYHAGVTAGLVGREVDAAEMFNRILVSPPPPGSMVHAAAEQMAPLANDSDAFRREIAMRIAKQRQTLKLAAADTLPF